MSCSNTTLPPDMLMHITLGGQRIADGGPNVPDSGLYGFEAQTVIGVHGIWVDAYICFHRGYQPDVGTTQGSPAVEFRYFYAPNNHDLPGCTNADPVVDSQTAIYSLAPGFGDTVIEATCVPGVFKWFPLINKRAYPTTTFSEHLTIVDGVAREFTIYGVLKTLAM